MSSCWTGVATKGDLGSCRRAGADGLAGFHWLAVRCIGFQLLPLLEVLAVLLSTLAKLLLFLLVHRLEAERIVFFPGQLFERRGNLDAPSVGSFPTPGEFSLGCPGMWRPGVFVVAEVAEIGFGATFPLTVLSMLPTLVGVDRIVAAAAGVVREPG